MLQTYKKLGLAGAACMLLGMAASKAAVTLTFAQSGGDVVATWSGSYDLPGAEFYTSVPVNAVLSGSSVYGNQGSGNAAFAAVHGTYSSPFASAVIGSYVGDTFGFFGSSLAFPIGETGLFSPVGIMTFAGTTLATLGVDSFNNSVAFTGTGDVAGSRQILVHTAGFGGGGPSAVPEPAGAATALICCVSGLLIRPRPRRRL